jgi:hypothetical protein
MAHLNKVVQAIYGRGFGGEAAVVVPGSVGDQLPSARPAAGVDEACSLLEHALDSGKDAVWIFLVGGPGNGKSHVLSRVLAQRGLTMSPAAGNLAPRSAMLNVNGSPFLVINDASIRPSDADGNGGAGDLARDLKTLFGLADSGTLASALVCINRGILVEELAKVPGTESWGKEREIISWLNSEGASKSEEADASFSSEFTRMRRIGGANGPRVLAVFLDRLSLLERQPLPTDEELGTFANYAVLPLRNPERLQSPAAELLSRLVTPEGFEGAECEGCPAQAYCPFLANARSLRSEGVQLGVLDTTRVSEIVSGHLCTYRDLWALYAGLVVGGDRPEFATVHPCEWVQSIVGGEIPGAGAPGKDALVKLVQHRFYEAIFPSLGELWNQEHRSGWIETPPIVERLRMVDPALDSSGAWAEAVDLATEAVTFRQFPLESIVEGYPAFQHAIAPVDEEVGRALLGPLVSDSEDYSEAERLSALRWRGLSLYRHFGFSMGHPAHAEIVNQWLRLRRIAGHEERDLPIGPLQAALNQLILPPSEHDSRYCLLPIFEPRVEPVVQLSEEVKWCQALQAAALVSWKIYALGDGLWLRLWVAGRSQPVSEFPLDFALCREALAQCVHNSLDDQACMPGFTELRSVVSPRLERVRASFLAAAAGIQRNLVVAHSRISGINLPGV